MFAAAVVATTVGGAFHLGDRLDDLARVDAGDALADPSGARNILLVGSDSRAGTDPGSPDFGSMGDEGDVSGQRSDTLMVLRVGPGVPASLLSIPRDLWVEIAGTGRSQRINTAFAKGPDVVVRTVRQALGIPVHHYVEIDFQAFKRLVDAVGGVDVWFDQPVRDANTGLAIASPGCHRLDGVQALAFARARHLEYLDGDRWRRDGTGDLGRMARQQYFVRRSVQAAVETGSRNPLAIDELLDAMISGVRMDDRLTRRDLVDLALRFRAVDPAGLATATVPADPAVIGGNAVLVLDARAADPVLAPFRGADPAEAIGALGVGESAGGVAVRVARVPLPSSDPVGLVPSRDC